MYQRKITGKCVRCRRNDPIAGDTLCLQCRLVREARERVLAARQRRFRELAGQIDCTGRNGIFAGDLPDGEPADCFGAVIEEPEQFELCPVIPNNPFSGSFGKKR